MSSAAREEASPAVAEPQVAAQPPAFVTLGLLAAGAIAWVRIAVALDLSTRVRGAEPAVAAFGVAARFLPELLNALVLGVVAAGVCVLGVVRPGASRGTRIAAFVFAALVLASALSGWPTADLRDTPLLTGGAGFWSPTLLVALAVVGAVVLSAAGVWLARGRGATRNHRAARGLGSPVAIGVAAVLGLGGPAAWALLTTRDAPVMPLRLAVRELLEPGALVPRTGFGAEERPRIATISPAVDWKFDVGDKPSVVLPPGHAVEFTVRAEDGPVRLLAAAGVDVSVAPKDGGAFTLRFQVEHNGQLVFDEAREVRANMPTDARAWRHVGGGGGLALAPGDKVLLRTVLEPEGAPFVPDALLVGFGGMILEREEHVPRTTATPDRPNILLVVMDTLRADRMSCYRYAKQTTPHVDALAARGMLFEEAFATSSWTWPATASILTGLDPEEHGVTSNESCTLVHSNETVAEAVQARGLTTGGFSGNPLIAPERYFDQGFETFHATPRMEMSDGLIDDVLGWIDRNADVRFFLYLQFVDPHTPHLPLASEVARLGAEKPADWPELVHEGKPVDGMDYYTSVLLRTENLREDGSPNPDLVPEAHRQYIHDLYDASVGTGDHYVGLVLERLAQLGLDENTVVVFTSDHGEELFDHGCLAHGHTLHRELVRVPMVIAGPGVPRGVRVLQTVSNRHLAPTLARVAGAEMSRVPGALNLIGELEGTTARALFSTAKGLWNGNKMQPLYGMREDRWVLHRNPQGRPFGAAQAEPGGELRLYDATSDPEERRSVLLAEPAKLAELSETLKNELFEQRKRRTAPAIAGGARTTNLLDGLGYIDSGDGTPPPVPDEPREQR